MRLFNLNTLLWLIALSFTSQDYPTQVHPVSQLIVRELPLGSFVLEGLESVTHPFPIAPPHYSKIIKIRSYNGFEHHN